MDVCSLDAWNIQKKINTSMKGTYRIASVTFTNIISVFELNSRPTKNEPS